MKFALWILTSCAFAFALSSCGNSGGSGRSGPSAATGPFDSRGNYIEEWADNPSKWRRGGGTPSPHERKSDVLPQIAKIDQPPPYSVPLSTVSITKPSQPAISRTQVITRPSVTRPAEKIVRAAKRPVERPREKVVAKVKSKQKVVTAKVKSKVKSKAKAQPKSTRYVVKRGDSLSTIARRTGSSVAAIKSKNGISGAVIRPGQALVIPKR
jgi:LysM repeat protein